ncbi:docking domain of Afi1 for Arf3 in vesicle trafficking-domain-containing protein [Crucibulum laeve]|uniref:Docking domain of Afi1 for Arf3 in vesicle trafficking-domain-containing protein n=1 Tax=Crucibulum laeve TaxID=68775 RepID=A0A5C3MGX7_9AGAR|nr:docking domain of Afi1 for Arf3 in vesicle trafficking-domain-containing protein [Crucibulum laeve]
MSSVQPTMSTGNHCSFVLLAEFDIYQGAQLKYQFPQPLGIDEGVLAMSMLPDGAETQLDDWTIFFLNQTSFNTISPVLALDTPEVKSVGLPGEDDIRQSDKPELLCVLNLVRTKHDKKLDRGAKVLALAICTRHPFIQIFKPFLLMALDDYLSDPSQDCLARLFDAVNSMDLSGAPTLTRYEKMVMRSSERKDIFAEKFAHLTSHQVNPTHGAGLKAIPQHKSTNSGESYSSFEEGILLRNHDKERTRDDNKTRSREKPRARDRADTDTSTTAPSSHSHGQLQNQQSPSDSSFSLGGSAVWVGDESGLDLQPKDNSGESGSVASIAASSTLIGSSRKRRSTDASSSTSSHLHGREQNVRQVSHAYYDSYARGTVKDTHFYHTSVAYKDHQLPIKMPLSTFPEEVGDYSLIMLIKVFSSHQQVIGPIHPHLHTNGPQTHPIIILFNALITGKRIVFLGHRRPAGEVSSFVLSACALGSGCGVVLRGFIERAFPYANLHNKDEWESVPAYIAGVTNPIFEASGQWDLLMDIKSGSVTVAKDIHSTYPASNTVGLAGPLVSRSGTLKAESSIGSEDDVVRIAKEGVKSDFTGKDNNADKMFIEDIRAAIDDHFGEGLVRMRFTEYVTRFVRLASRYEEEITGSTRFGYSSAPFAEIPGRSTKLGSGIAFSDEATCLRELSANAHRIEAWRKTNSYHCLVMDYAKQQISSPIRGFDVLHQLFRLRYTKNMVDTEVLMIMRSLADNVKTYEQVVELLAYLPHGGGLLYLGFCLFHQKEAVREATVDLFNQLRVYPVGVMYLQALNHFQRYAYVRQAHAREKQQEQRHQYHHHQETAYPIPMPGSSFSSRMHSNSIIGERVHGAF